MEERERERKRVEKGGVNEEELKRPRVRGNREGGEERERANAGTQGCRERENKRASAPARFDFAGWVRNNSANYYSALVHIDRYVAPDLYIAWL